MPVIPIKLPKKLASVPCFVDFDDYWEVSKHGWSCNEVAKGKFYAIRVIKDKETGKQYSIQMHRQILNAPKGQEIDHKNRNGLDNRRENLRFCTRSQNMANCGVKARKVDKNKGVRKRDGSNWEAYITEDGKFKHIGSYLEKNEALKAYNQAAKEIFGEFAFQNEIPGDGKENL